MGGTADGGRLSPSASLLRAPYGANNYIKAQDMGYFNFNINIKAEDMGYFNFHNYIKAEDMGYLNFHNYIYEWVLCYCRVGRDDFKLSVTKPYGHETRSIGYRNKHLNLYGRV